MTAPKRLFILYALLLLGISFPLSRTWSTERRTVHAECIGNPLLSRYPRGEAVYARNVWDLQAFEGRLYIGAGNSNNRGPAQNAGPVPIIAYDPHRDRFQQEYLVDDEQIDQYYVFDGELYLPGHDPRQSWELGNLYHLAAGKTWRKLRTIPRAIHTYALALDKGVLYAGLGSSTKQKKPIAAVAVSTDGGQGWNWHPLGGLRTYAFLQVAGTLYATEVYPPFPTKRTATYEIHGPQTIVPRDDLDRAALFPGLSLQQRPTRVVKPVRVGDRAVYIGGYPHIDHQFLPFGVYVAHSLQPNAVHVQRSPLPANQRPWDLLVRDHILYVLLDKPGEADHKIRVMASNDGASWSEVLAFEAPTFARSFEILNGDFYFGLGCEIPRWQDWMSAELPSATGTILRVRRDQFTLPASPRPISE